MEIDGLKQKKEIERYNRREGLKQSVQNLKWKFEIEREEAEKKAKKERRKKYYYRRKLKMRKIDKIIDKNKGKILDFNNEISYI